MYGHMYLPTTYLRSTYSMYYGTGFSGHSGTMPHPWALILSNGEGVEYVGTSHVYRRLWSLESLARKVMTCLVSSSPSEIEIDQGTGT